MLGTVHSAAVVPEFGAQLGSQRSFAKGYGDAPLFRDGYNESLASMGGQGFVSGGNAGRSHHNCAFFFPPRFHIYSSPGRVARGVVHML